MADRPRVTISELLERDSHKRSELIRLASEGCSVKRTASQVGVSLEILYKLLKTDPLFRNEWEMARKDAADTMADELLDVMNDAETVADAMIGKAKSENIKTVVGWRNPSRYSPKMQVEVTHSVDLSKALQQAERRTIPILEQAQLERSGSGDPTLTPVLGSIPPVEEVAPALHQDNNINDFNSASNSTDSTKTVLYNKDGSIKTMSPYGKPSGRPLGRLNDKKFTPPVIDRSDHAAIKDMARRKAEQDYQVSDISNPDTFRVHNQGELIPWHEMNVDTAIKEYFDVELSPAVDKTVDGFEEFL